MWTTSKHGLGGGIVPTLNSFENSGDVRATVLILFEADRRDGIRLHENTTPTLQSFMGTGGGNVPMIHAEEKEMQTVRRLTPTECERLQGFPDGWTDGQTDGHRYKQMGNAVTVNVTETIGQFIMQAEGQDS